MNTGWVTDKGGFRGQVGWGARGVCLEGVEGGSDGGGDGSDGSDGGDNKKSNKYSVVNLKRNKKT